MKLQYLVSNSKIVGFIPLPSYLVKCGLNSTTILACEGADLLVCPFIFERRKYVI